MRARLPTAPRSASATRLVADACGAFDGAIATITPSSSSTRSSGCSTPSSTSAKNRSTVKRSGTVPAGGTATAMARSLQSAGPPHNVCFQVRRGYTTPRRRSSSSSPGPMPISASTAAVSAPVGEGPEARVVAQVCEPDALHQPLPELLLHAHDDDPAVARLEALAGDEALVRALRETLRAPVAVEGPDGHVVQHRDGRVEERDVEVTAYSGRAGAVEADHERQRGEDAAREVDDRHAALGGRRVGLARDAHEARVGLQEVVVARIAGARAGAPEAGE